MRPLPLLLVSILTVTTSALSDGAQNGSSDRIVIMASIVDLLPNLAASGVGEHQKRYDILELKILRPKDLADRYRKSSLELELPTSGRNLELKKQTGHFVLLTVSQADFELYEKYDLMLVGPSPMPTFSDLEHPSEPTPIAELPDAKRTPNQLPDPTSPSVTPAAGAADAPSVAADH
jgi:hypothetical protein